MDLLKFTLSGRSAFFKKPELNSVYYFSYGCIHRVALLGMLGGIIGCEGYSQMKKIPASKKNREEEDIYPEFYRELSALKISIVPRNEKGLISKKIQYFNNSIGYASKEQGGNLIIKEQWLESPIWDIYIQLNSNISLKIADYILSNKCVYIPYLGKNDHFADISNMKRTYGKAKEDNIKRIDSLFKRDAASFSSVFDIDDEEDNDVELAYKYEESLPIRLSESTNLYEMERCVFGNMAIQSYEEELLEADGKILAFL
jgi:CRISPR-associated protein Cas5h